MTGVARESWAGFLKALLVARSLGDSLRGVKHFEHLVRATLRRVARLTLIVFKLATFIYGLRGLRTSRDLFLQALHGAEGVFRMTPREMEPQAKSSSSIWFQLFLKDFSEIIDSSRRSWGSILNPAVKSAFPSRFPSHKSVRMMVEHAITACR